MNLTEIQARDAATDAVWFKRTRMQSVTELAVRDRRELLAEVERLHVVAKAASQAALLWQTVRCDDMDFIESMDELVKAVKPWRAERPADAGSGEPK